MHLSPKAIQLLGLLRSQGERGFTEGMAFDPALDSTSTKRFEDHEDVRGLRELEAAGLVTIDVYDSSCWTLGATLRRCVPYELALTSEWRGRTREG